MDIAGLEISYKSNVLMMSAFISFYFLTSNIFGDSWVNRKHITFDISRDRILLFVHFLKRFEWSIWRLDFSHLSFVRSSSDSSTKPLSTLHHVSHGISSDGTDDRLKFQRFFQLDDDIQIRDRSYKPSHSSLTWKIWPTVSCQNVLLQSNSFVINTWIGGIKNITR